MRAGLGPSPVVEHSPTGSLPRARSSSPQFQGSTFSEGSGQSNALSRDALQLRTSSTDSLERLECGESLQAPSPSMTMAGLSPTTQRHAAGDGDVLVSIPAMPDGLEMVVRYSEEGASTRSSRDEAVSIRESGDVATSEAAQALCCPTVIKKNDWPYFVVASTYMLNVALSWAELLVADMDDASRDALAISSVTTGSVCWIAWDMCALRKVVEETRRCTPRSVYRSLSLLQSSLFTFSAAAGTTRMALATGTRLMTSGASAGATVSGGLQVGIDVTQRMSATGSAISTLMLPVLWHFARREQIPAEERTDSTTFMPQRFAGLALVAALQVQAWLSSQDTQSVSTIGTATRENAGPIDYVCNALSFLSALFMMYYTISHTDWTCGRIGRRHQDQDENPDEFV